VIAPDVYVVFGRPKGDRPSWKQWEEGGVPMTVVFEILSPENSHRELVDKLAFYEEYGVEEYYEYDPDNNHLIIYVRQGEMLRRRRPVSGFVSPRLGIRFDLSGEELVVLRPDGRRFLTFEELEAERATERARRVAAEQRASRLAELSRKVRRQQATPEELAELERLEEQPPSA
jgi:Uma2 family endonuclease